jgi:hypothetical protein
VDVLQEWLRDSDKLQFQHLLSVLRCCLHKLWHNYQALAMIVTRNVICPRNDVRCVDRLATVGGLVVVVTSIRPLPVPSHCCHVVFPALANPLRPGRVSEWGEFLRGGGGGNNMARDGRSPHGPIFGEILSAMPAYRSFNPEAVPLDWLPPSDRLLVPFMLNLFSVCVCVCQPSLFIYFINIDIFSFSSFGAHFLPSCYHLYL